MKYFIYLLISIHLYSFSQLSDDFSSFNSYWKGQKQYFTISNNTLQLQGLNTTAQQYKLYTENNLSTDSEWNLLIDLKFNPTSSNFVRWYLYSTDSSLSSASEAYFIQLGETNSDTLDFYKQTGNTLTKIFTGTTAFSSNVNAKIRVTHSADGTWKFWLNDVFQGQTTQLPSLKCSFTGILCQYNTASRYNQFYFDDYIIKPITLDYEAPKLQYVNIVNNSLIELQWNKCIQQLGNKFSIENIEILQIDSSQKYNGKINLYTSNLDTNQTYLLKTDSISDCFSNKSAPTETEILLPEKLKKGSIFFNEIMPSATSTKPEYFELFLNFPYNSDLKELYISRLHNGTYYNTQNLKIPNPVKTTQKYLVFSPDKNLLMQSIPLADSTSIILCSDWLGLLNDSATLILHDSAYRVIDQVHYEDGWHSKLLTNTSGVSLEKIEELYDSNNSQNWFSASEKSNFGTPTMRNSQHITGENSATELSCKVISPNQDGYNDYCILKIKNNPPGTMANVKIVNLDGSVVKNMGQNISIAENQELLWDGTTDANQKAPTGPYLIWIERYGINLKTTQTRLEIAVFE